ncbi:MAG: hypothetical protein OMM_04812 [Candidatus Magnetoglobus multicellularis str. Araruama]|uniref:Uncharacterized protein n=1 Tax=Candidatus Magnetoglobus multicellularis str. Araruama TaxID=890399 RepID=A0A1V1NZU3_9BACT|nr:MAG: hypothetical protein OMM_04812 [Candidatus Magnetoglobus multicellularis str. Araruama]
MKITKIMGVLAIAGVLMVGSLAYADPERQIVINGIVPAILSMEVTDTEENVDLNELGRVAYEDKIIGNIVIDSNSATGFQIDYTSANSGFLQNGIGEVASYRKIDYTVSLINAAGTLGDGTSEGTLEKVSPTDAVSFSGNNAAPTVARSYDVAINTPIKTLEAGSGYTDTLTLTISTI